jgi:hypothetical protein
MNDDGLGCAAVIVIAGIPLGLTALLLFSLLGIPGLALGAGILIVLFLLLVSGGGIYGPEAIWITLFAPVCLGVITGYLSSQTDRYSSPMSPEAWSIAGIALWFLFIVGTIAITRSTLAAAISLVVLLIGLFTMHHWFQFITYQGYEYRYLSLIVPGLFIVLCLLGLLATGPVDNFGEGNLMVCGVLALILITIGALGNSGLDPVVLGALLGLWVLLIVGGFFAQNLRGQASMSNVGVSPSIDKIHKEVPAMTRSSVPNLWQHRTPSSAARAALEEEEQKYVEEATTMSNRYHIINFEQKYVSDDEARSHQRNFDSLIEEQTDHLRRGPIRIFRNPFTSWFRRVRIPQGRQAILLCNGKVQRVLSAGAYHVLAFPWFQKIQLLVFDTSVRRLDIKPGDDFTLFYESSDGNRAYGKNRVPINVSLEVVVSYQVVDPLRLINHREALGTLYDAAVDAMRAEIKESGYHEFKAGDRAGKYILNTLQGNAIITELGIKVLEVVVIGLRGDNNIDPALVADELARMNPEIFKVLRPEQWLALREIDRQEGRDRVDAIIAAIAHLPPQQAREFLDRIFEQPQLVRPQVVTVLPNHQAPALLPAEQHTATAKRNGRGGQKRASSKRIRQEVASLQRQGISAVLNDSSGAYRVTALFLNADETPVKVVIECPPAYPQEAPTMQVEHSGTTTSFTPDALSTWDTDSSLTELIAAARRAYA